MSNFLDRITGALNRLRGRREPLAREERRRAPRFICSYAVIWESGREQGEGILREVSATGLKLRAEKALLAGRSIRIRPLKQNPDAPLSLDVAIGTVIYSRKRSGGIEIGIELINPDRISRFAWLTTLRHGAHQPALVEGRLGERAGRLRLVTRQDTPSSTSSAEEL